MLPAQVEAAISRYVTAVDAALPGLLEGLYLVGSVVLDDFQPSVSDVDFVAVTAAAPDGAATELLGVVHAGVRADRALPATDGCYVTWDELRTSPKHLGPGLGYHDGRLSVGQHGRTPVDWAVLARHATVLRGCSPGDVPVAAAPVELRAWTLDNLATYWDPWLRQSRDLASRAAMAMLTDWGVAWSVLGICRLCVTLATGDIVSKTVAGVWALAAFDDRWHPILSEALRCRPLPLALPGDPAAAGARRDEATAFVAEAIGRARQLAGNAA